MAAAGAGADAREPRAGDVDRAADGVRGRGAWVAGLIGRAAGPGDVLAAFGARVQVASLAVMVAAAVVLVLRREPTWRIR